MCIWHIRLISLSTVTDKMKKFILSALIGSVFSHTAAYAQSDKTPLPESFKERINVILRLCGDMNTGLKVAIILLILTIAVTVIFYLMRNVKRDK